MQAKTASAKPTITPQKLKIGEYSVHAVPTGIFGLDGGAMFGTVPRTLWEKTNPPDEHNRIALEARVLLLVSKTKKILVDVGLGGDFNEKYGEKLGPKFAEIYAVTKGAPGLVESLKKMGIEIHDITDVILTHLHFDHAGGSTTWRGGKLVPTFPNATYYVQKENLKTAETPNLREKASYFAANFKPLVDSKQLKVLEGDTQNVLPGINVFVSNGHTVGQQLVEVTDGKTKLIYCGDIVPTSSHVRLPFVMGYDLNPLMVIDEKREVLKRVSNGQGYIFFEHDAYCDAARVAGAEDDFKVTELIKFEN